MTNQRKYFPHVSMTQRQLYHPKAHPSMGDKSGILHPRLSQHSIQSTQTVGQSPLSQHLLTVFITLGRCPVNIITCLLSEPYKFQEVLCTLERAYFIVEKMYI